MRKIIYKVGQKFNKLILLKELKPIRTKTTSYRIALWQCDCGKKKKIIIQNVVRGYTKSCGCYNSELTIKRNKEVFSTHRMTKSRLFKIWDDMKYRCKSHKDYGGRGIKVCRRWLRFDNFRNDMYKSYLEHVKKYGKKQTSIDRIDNDGNYESNNCRWATCEEQNNNKRNTFLITYKDKTANLLYWEKIMGIKKELIFKRIWEQKWSVKKALNTLPQKRKNKKF